MLFRSRKIKASIWVADAGLVAMAQKTGVPAPSPGPWLQMLCDVMERQPYGMLVTDMQVPGLPITYCNIAMTKLTGYERGEICGRNCRFLQGPGTEASAVRQMVVAVRTATLTTVRVTNYRRDLSKFINVVTMAPVHDSNGVYRYSIGVLSDSADALSDGAALAWLRAVLPKSMSADAQPPVLRPTRHSCGGTGWTRRRVGVQRRQRERVGGCDRGQASSLRAISALSATEYRDRDPDE